MKYQGISQEADINGTQGMLPDNDSRIGLKSQHKTCELLPVMGMIIL